MVIRGVSFYDDKITPSHPSLQAMLQVGLGDSHASHYFHKQKMASREGIMN